MRIERSKVELYQYLEDCINILKSRIKNYESGKTYEYREVANQLRILLCDTKNRKPNALLPKIFPDMKFHPLSFQPNPIDYYRNGRELGFFIHGPITKVNGIVRVPDLFNLNAEPINLDKWLKQCIISPQITLRDFIKSIVEKNGGAHVDDSPNGIIIKGEFLSLKDVKSKIVYIVEIGRYVLSVIKKRMLVKEKKV